MQRSALALVTVLVLAGCGSSGTAPEAPPDFSDVPESQRAALLDGVVTYEEYRESMVHDRDCVVASGIFTTVFDVVEADDGTLGFEAEWDSDAAGESDGMNPEVFAEIREECEAEHSQFVARAWFEQSTLSVEERDAMRPLLMGCLNDAGLPLTPDARDSEFSSVISQYFEDQANGAVAADTVEAVDGCLSDYARYFMVPDEAKDT